MHSNSHAGAKRILALTVLFILLMSMFSFVQAESSRTGSISNFRLMDAEPAAGVTTRYKVTIKQAGQLTAVLTDKDTGAQTPVWDKYYGYSQNILLQVPGKLIESGHNYSLDLSLAYKGKVVGTANHTYTIAKPVAQISALSASASFNPAVGEPLSVNITLPNPSNVYMYVKKGSQVVGAVAENMACPAGTTTLYWSGVGIDGKMCPAGTYTLYAQCNNAAGISPIVTASFQLKGDAAKAISGRVDGTVTSCILPRQPEDGEKPTFYINASRAGRYTLKLSNLTSGASTKLTGELQAGLNALTINSAAIGGHEYRFQLIEQVSGRTTGKAQMNYTARMDPPSLSISAPASLEAGYGAAMPITYTSGTSGTVIIYIMDTTHHVIYSRNVLTLTQKGSGTVYWNGLDMNGNLLADGTYHVCAEAINNAGQVYSNTVVFKYEGQISGLGAPRAEGAIRLFAPADNPEPAELTPIRFRVQTTSAGTLKVTLRQTSTETKYTVYNAYISAGMNTITIPGDYFGAASYELEASLISGKKTLGKAVSFVKPKLVKPKITSFASSDGFESKWQPVYSFSFDTASTGKLYVRIEDFSGNVIRYLNPGQYTAAGHHAYTWDGRNDKGAYAASGKYRTVVVYQDRYGNYSNVAYDTVKFDGTSYPSGIYGYEIVGIGDHKTPVYLYDKPGGSVTTVTYAISATFDVLEDLGDWLYVEGSCVTGAPQKGYVQASALQKIAITSPYRIEVCISRTGSKAQTFWLYHEGKLVDKFEISSGLVEGSTPTGDFCLLNRKPYFTVLGGQGICYDALRVCGGVCIHRVPLLYGSYTVSSLGRPASHGCIRVPVDRSQWLYDNIPDTTPIHIFYAN